VKLKTHLPHLPIDKHFPVAHDAFFPSSKFGLKIQKDQHNFANIDAQVYRDVP
jgi:hypothetical protein